MKILITLWYCTVSKKDGPGIESRWGEIFCTCPDLLRGPPSLLYIGYQVFPGCKAARAWH